MKKMVNDNDTNNAFQFKLHNPHPQVYVFQDSLLNTSWAYRLDSRRGSAEPRKFKIL